MDCGIPRLFTIKELAEILKVKYRRASKLVSSGEIKSVQVGLRPRIKETAINEYLDRDNNEHAATVNLQTKKQRQKISDRVRRELGWK